MPHAIERRGASGCIGIIGAGAIERIGIPIAGPVGGGKPPSSGLPQRLHVGSPPNEMSPHPPHFTRMARCIAEVRYGCSGAVGKVVLIIPVRQSDHLVRRWPLVTILLVLVNLALYVNLVWVSRDADPRELRARMLEVVRYHEAHPYLEAPPGLVAAERDASVTITPRDPPITAANEQVILDGMWTKIEEIRKESISYEYGDLPIRGGALTLITSQFLHASLPHVLFNMWFLWLVGTTLEDRWGRILFAIFYLLAGCAATLVHRRTLPESDIPVIGASGAVSGAMGAFLVRSARTKIEFWGWIVLPFRFRAPAYLMLPLWFVGEVISGLGASTGVAHWAHVGGFVFGMVAGFAIWGTGIESAISGKIEREVAPAAPLPPPTPRTANDLAGIIGILTSDGAEADAANAFAQARNRGLEARLQPSLRLRGARALERVGRVAEADTAYAQLHQNTPQDTTGFMALLAHAELLLKQGRREDSRRLFEIARSSPVPHSHLDDHIAQGLRRSA
jgi:membrane associated rhomboid family serine protease